MNDSKERDGIFAGSRFGKQSEAGGDFDTSSCPSTGCPTNQSESRNVRGKEAVQKRGRGRKSARSMRSAHRRNHSHDKVPERVMPECCFYCGEGIGMVGVSAMAFQPNVSYKPTVKLCYDCFVQLEGGSHG